LQSLVIVLLKQIMAIATHMINAPQPGPQQSVVGQNGGRVNGGPGLMNNALNGAVKTEVTSPSDSDVDEARSREIAAKAVTGILITLLKWFKLSRMFSEERDPPCLLIVFLQTSSSLST
jgi:hypothetical protein